MIGITGVNMLVNMIIIFVQGFKQLKHMFLSLKRKIKALVSKKNNRTQKYAMPRPSSASNDSDNMIKQEKDINNN
jgi:hypothetical protein